MIRPSSAGIWGRPDGCQAYPTVAALFPDLGDKSAADEGTAAHSVGEHLIREGMQALKYSDFAGTVANNGVPVDDMMQEACEGYADYCLGLLRSAGVFATGEYAGLECAMNMPEIHEQLKGTCDFWVYDRSKGVIHVVDFKYGHRGVDAFENLQLLCYLSGVMGLLGIADDQQLWFKLHIYQPRAYHRDGITSEWGGQLSILRGYFNQLSQYAESALQGGGVARAGSYCLDCEGRYACETNRKAAAAAMDYASAPEFALLEPDHIGLELELLDRAADLIEARRSGLEAQALDLINREAKVVQGRAIEAKYGRRTWTKPAAEVLALGPLFGADLRQDKPITPNQAIKAGVPEEIVKQYTHVPSRGFKLVRDSGQLARKVFTK